MGRLTFPIVCGPNDTHFRRASWDEAMRIAGRLVQTDEIVASLYAGNTGIDLLALEPGEFEVLRHPTTGGHQADQTLRDLAFGLGERCDDVGQRRKGDALAGLHRLDIFPRGGAEDLVEVADFDRGAGVSHAWRSGASAGAGHRPG